MIHLICAAIEFNMGYQGSYSRVGRNGEEWSDDLIRPFQYVGNSRKVANEEKHATVYVVCQYRNKINSELRERLGEAYGEWERLSDDTPIPIGMILWWSCIRIFNSSRDPAASGLGLLSMFGER